MSLFLADLGKFCAKILEPPPRMTVSQWADSFRYLSRESSSQHGKYRSSNAPYQREPMDSVNDATVTSTCLMWASQVGKTELLCNIVGYFIAADPAAILMVQPTIEFGESWSKERLVPMVRDTPALTGLVKDARSRDSGNTILHKLFPGGNIAIAGANAPTGLAGRPRRVVLLDEVDRYPASAGSEGDPCALAIRRTESFWNAVIFLTSTPTTKGASRIESEFLQTDQRRWFCPCPKCGEFQTMKWAQVKWPDDQPEDAFYECEKCQAHLNDHERVKMVKAGEWRATAPFTGKRGFHINGICSLFKHKRGFKNRLHQMAAGFLEAKAGGVETLKTWVNTFLAETFEEEGEGIEVDPLLNRREDYAPDRIPNGPLILTWGADVQKDRIEAEVVGWGVDEEAWGLKRTTIIGNPEVPETFDKLYHFIHSEFTNESGRKLKPLIGCIDSGYATKQVLAFVKRCAPMPVYATKGSSVRLRAPVQTPKRASRSMALLIDTVEFKTAIYSRLKLEIPGPRYLHFPKDYDEEFFAQLTAERVRKTFRHGHAVLVWENVRPNRRNEALDIRVCNHAALAILRPNWPALVKNLALVKAIGNIKETDNVSTPEKPPEPIEKPKRADPRRNPFARFNQKWSLK